MTQTQLPTAVSVGIPITGAEVTAELGVTPPDPTPPVSDAPVNAPSLTTENASVFIPLMSISPPPLDTWPTVAANPQRTSWSPADVTPNSNVEWYRPIEAYIPQNAQLIASDGLIFVSTARGLYALNAATGAVVWRFDTELPLGNSPTVQAGIVYVGGYDRKLHALRASDGHHLWSYAGALAGYSTNPLVVDGRIFIGNRDGRLYAIGAHGAPQQGQLIWSYPTGGLIDLSAAYHDGVVYFASNDNHAYALQAASGALVWKSAKLPGDGYHSYWPVIYQDKVIFSAASGYRHGSGPGTLNVLNASGQGYGSIFDAQRDDLFHGQSDGALIGPQLAATSWSGSKPVLDASRIAEYLEINPDGDPHVHKPWRRVTIVLNRSNGIEYTQDTDGDGFQEYVPITLWGTRSGNRYPPLVGSDGLLYISNVWQRFYIPQGKLMGWKLGTELFSIAGAQGATDEPNAISSGGTRLYRSICCDRVGDWLTSNSNAAGQLWHYGQPLSQKAPGYDQMWYLDEGGFLARLHGNYGTPNGVYNNHGDQNPIIPYQGRHFIHRGNAVIAFGPNTGPGQLPLLAINPATDPVVAPTVPALTARLETEIQKIVDAGHLRPGYYNQGQFGNYSQFDNYFENPGDTLLALSLAYPHLSTGLKSQVVAYLAAEYSAYFGATMYTRIGWADGAAREAMPLPPEVSAALASYPKSAGQNPRWSWSYPPHNLYALWKYAANVTPASALQIYSRAKAVLQVPVPAPATNAYLIDRPFEHNAYIAGYFGFLELQTLAGQAGTDAALRTQVTNELNRLLALRASTFSADTPWVDGNGSYHLRTLNVSRNFIYLVPELGEYLALNAASQVNAAIAEYDLIAPYWFVARYNATVNEGVRQNLYDYHGMFLAHAYILDENRSQLTKHLDVPAFERGDLFYIQNLVAAINAAP